MKKLIKFIMGVVATAGVVIGALYVWKKYFGGSDSEDFEEDEFDDVFADEVDDREYVTLDIDDEEDDDEDDIE
ncbi:MAG: hypothetical protein J1E62_04710 [Lachnospiraceae bacterium]|nr:hypothetical protein [Lachnospiraceae bacterium]